MTRQEELKGIGYLRMVDIEESLNMNHDKLRYRIKKLGLIPFETWYYSEEQIDLIINFEITIK